MAIKKVEGVFRNLPVTSLLNAFTVMEDEDRIRFSNVFRSYGVSDNIKNNSLLFEFYTVEAEEFLDDISSKFYGTPTLWWVVADFNESINPFEALDEGETVKILNGNILYAIFDDIQQIGEL